MLRNNIAIITSYNDMLSAHQPYEHYPDIIRKAHEANAVGGCWRCSCNVRRCDPGTGWDGAFRCCESRSDCYVGLLWASHNMFDGALFLGVCDKIVPGLVMAALSFGHLPSIFIPSGPMAVVWRTKKRCVSVSCMLKVKSIVWRCLNPKLRLIAAGYLYVLWHGKHQPDGEWVYGMQLRDPHSLHLMRRCASVDRQRGSSG